MGVFSFFLIILLSFIFTAIWMFALGGKNSRDNWLFAGSIAAVMALIFDAIAIVMGLNFGLWDEVVLSIFLAYGIPMTLATSEISMGEQ